MEQGELAFSRGRVVWWRDELSAASCTAPGRCDRVPVELVLNAAGLYFAFGTAANHSCFGRVRGAVPFTIGKPVWYVSGDTHAPARSGERELLTTTYPWLVTGARPRTATEVDTIDARSDRELAETVRVPGRDGAPPVSFATSFTDQARTPPAPVVNSCA